MTPTLLKDKYAIILCGGRGSRLGSITDTIPKSLVQVHNKPILWYTFLTLYKYGFRKFICPLGYKGDLIRKFVNEALPSLDWDIHLADTGENTAKAERLHQVLETVPAHHDFFLINGDTLFDFDIVKMYQLHLQQDALLTLSSTEIVSTYGLIIEEDGEVTNFTLEQPISHFSPGEFNHSRGYVNAGFTWINRDALLDIDLEKCHDFEQEVYTSVIKMGRAAHFKLNDIWFPIDTAKDLAIVNLNAKTKQTIGHAVNAMEIDLSEMVSKQQGKCRR